MTQPDGGIQLFYRIISTIQYSVDKQYVDVDSTTLEIVKLLVNYL